MTGGEVDLVGWWRGFCCGFAKGSVVLRLIVYSSSIYHGFCNEDVAPIG